MNDKIVLLLNSSIFVARDFKKIKKLIKFKNKDEKKKANLQWGLQRIKQHILGLKRLEQLDVFKDFSNIIFTDNTVNSKILVPRKITKTLPLNTIYILRRINKIGKFNKGAGLIENLQYCIKYIENFDYLVYFEPRLYATNNYFFKDFLSKPRNLFYKQKNDYKSGYFGVSTKDFINFLNKTNTNEMIEKNLTVESLLFKEFENLKPDYILEAFTKRNIGYQKKLTIHDKEAYEIY
tara:strand:- start:3576 stop:4283 length:708 start_codon:yes stop_codon:yes gene_type:complete